MSLVGKWTARRLQGPYVGPQGLHRFGKVSIGSGRLLQILDVRPDPDVEVRLVPARIGTGLLSFVGGALFGGDTYH